MTVPGGFATTLFLIGGTLFTITLGVILTFLPTIYPKVVGWILMIDGIIYPTSSFFTGYGDFALAHPVFTPVFISITAFFYLISYLYYRKSGRGEKENS